MSAFLRAAPEKAELLRGPERMFYGLVELEVRDPDGHRIWIGGDAPANAKVRQREEREEAA